MKIKRKKNKYFFRKFFTINQFGYSISEMVVVISIVGILMSILVPNFKPALEFVEVLIAEKYLLKAVKECQIGIINGESSPQYSLPTNQIGLGIFKNNNFNFTHTGIGGECAPEYGGNLLRVSRTNTNSENIIYSLIINVKTGEKSYQGKLPSWLDWWEGKSSTFILENEN